MRGKRVLCTVFIIILLIFAALALLEYFEVTDFYAPEEPPRVTESPRMTQPPTPTPEPTPEPSPTATPEPTPTPRPFPNVPKQDQPAPTGYFEDAIFLGNSLVDGLKLYWYNGHLDGATYHTGTSLTIFGVGSYLDQMADENVGKVYVGLGMNEIDYNKDVLREEFAELIETVRGYNPDAIIYLMSVTPVSRWKDQNSDLHNMRSVESFNAMLRDVADQNDCYFMDLTPVLAGEDGYLPAEVTNDGVHFTPEYYIKWFDYLEYNYVLPVLPETPETPMDVDGEAPIGEPPAEEPVAEAPAAEQTEEAPAEGGSN